MEIFKFLGLIESRKMKPTKNHRLTIWECMLGTIFAMNNKGIIKYFDYDYQAAIIYVGINSHSDPRISVMTVDQAFYRWHSNVDEPNGTLRKGRIVL